MELYELNQKIINKNLPKITILVGEEWSIIKIYIEQICKYMSLSRFDTDNPISILAPQKTISLVGDKLLYVSRYTKEILTAEKNWANIKYLGTNYLVLVYTSIDKRSKFYNYFKDNFVEFSTQDNKTLKIMLKGKHNLCEKAEDRLIAMCKNNYGRCLIEIDKIKTLSKIRDITEDDSYRILIKDGAVYETNTTNIDNFVNFVLQRQKICYNKYIILKENNESNIQIISWLYNAFRTQLIVESVKTPNTESTGLNYYFIKQALDRKHKYTIKELENALNLIRNTEQGIKTGDIDEPISIDYILSNVL